MTKINKSSNKSFGIVFFVFFLIIAMYPLLNSDEVRLWSLLISMIFLILGIFNSNILSPLNKVWFIFGLFLGKYISPLVMMLIYYIVVTPIGFLIRMLNKDILQLKYSKNISYWINKDKTSSGLDKQF